MRSSVPRSALGDTGVTSVLPITAIIEGLVVERPSSSPSLRASKCCAASGTLCADSADGQRGHSAMVDMTRATVASGRMDSEVASKHLGTYICRGRSVSSRLDRASAGGIPAEGEQPFGTSRSESLFPLSSRHDAADRRRRWWRRRHSPPGWYCYCLPSPCRRPRWPPQRPSQRLIPHAMTIDELSHPHHPHHPRPHPHAFAVASRSESRTDTKPVCPMTHLQSGSEP